ncbi:MAG TPA: exosortase V [Caulobacteraceae bacterium]|nr:exosortase V [Caulobacteraceae bacterium]
MAIPKPTQRAGLGIAQAWLTIVAFAVLAIPTAVTLGDQTWSTETGAQGPLVLCTGAWLLWRLAPEFRARAEPGSPWLTALLLVPALAFYVFGRAYDFITFEVAGVYGVGLAMFQARLGARLMMRNWFPFLYLASVIPPPEYLLVHMTAPLKQFVSQISTEWLAAFGVPVARQGVTIFVAQYQLLVEDACSGMNSIIGIVAITLLYIYLTRGSSWRYSLLLTSLAVPIAIVANILRIMTLILLTYGFGDEVAQGFLHYTAGFFLFAMALLLVFALDRLFGVIGHRFGQAHGRTA